MPDSIAKPAAPFSYTYSANLPELLLRLKCSLVISTYQSGKVIIFSAKDANSLVQLPRTFDKPMGMALSGHRLAIANRQEVIVTANASGLAPHYPDKPHTYDALYIPRATYYTGEVDIHDLKWVGDKLLAVNTAFSCLSVIDEDYSFRPVWKPPFISALKPEDRCHLNGLALANGKPAYVTALGSGDSPQSWRTDMLKGGILMGVDSSELILDRLPVPHSPRVVNGRLLLLLSATGELVEVDKAKGSYEVITRFRGFVRGMEQFGDYLFIGLSRLRPGSTLFTEAPIAKSANHCGIAIVHLPTGKQVAELVYTATVEELYDVGVLPGQLRPNILNTNKNYHTLAVVTPQEVFWRQPETPANPS
ncbi:TIGR03032 family protein [Cesiribacter andamanensis]|uniref:Conserved hypothetical protein CHP03032 domain-containing protein n=1 Tax=Cesiribacter andamanensis AMV16 TaxID=1279009 RepID=M7NMA0_9BACT|nr:TIGR03032 family protein [Cesiribacter andamanensis]EMR02910.1 hypothetical protein ADICEAN_01948 [Cesiribacter andamanensis AMV16]